MSNEPRCCLRLRLSNFETEHATNNLNLNSCLLKFNIIIILVVVFVIVLVIVVITTTPQT